MIEEAIKRTDLLERVILPLGNISRTLAYLLDREFDVDPDSLRSGLRLIQADAEEAYNFLLSGAARSDRSIEPRTPDQLRRLVALMPTGNDCEKDLTSFKMRARGK